MRAEEKFSNLPLDFWANVRLISQKAGYTDRRTGEIKVPTFNEIVDIYASLGLQSSAIFYDGKPTDFGTSLVEYFQHRATLLKYAVEPNLMKVGQARDLFEQLYKDLRPQCPIPINRQKLAQGAPAYFTAIINMLIEENLRGRRCNYSPKELTAFTYDQAPFRSLSRRTDGCFPDVINPIAVWEIKEYYYTTTFGSRIADGIFETLLDGFELQEVRESMGIPVKHYLMVDAYETWWTQGRSYLCRICDMLHMGLLTEAIFGREVLDRIPIITKEWIMMTE